MDGVITEIPAFATGAFSVWGDVIQRSVPSRCRRRNAKEIPLHSEVRLRVLLNRQSMSGVNVTGSEDALFCFTSKVP